MYRTLFVMAILACASSINAKLLYVATNGNNTTNDGSSGSPWATIAKAVGSGSTAAAGDTIIVRTGTYSTAQVDFSKSGTQGNPITLKAEANVILNCAGENGFNLWQSHDWVIEGFRMNSVPHWGIALWGARNITIQHCYIYRAGASAIIGIVSDFGTDDIYPVPQLYNIKVLNNTIEGANYTSGDNEGISIWATDGFEVAHNRLIDCRREGIDCKTGSRNGTVHHNVISGQANNFGGTGMGVYIDAWHYPTFNIDIYNNLVYNSEEGVEINCEDCARGGYVRDIRVFNNVFYNNIDPLNSGWKGRGMSFYSCCDAGPHTVDSVHIFNNTMVGSKIAGISLENSNASHIFIRNNIIVNNGSNNDINISQCASVTVENNIVSAAVRNSAGASATVTDNRVENPLFVNAAGRDYHLQSTSAAINRASGSDVAPFDFDDVTRPQGAGADIGAYEYTTSSSRYSVQTQPRRPCRIEYEPNARVIRLIGAHRGSCAMQLMDVSGKLIAKSSQPTLQIPSSAHSGVMVVRSAMGTQTETWILPAF